MGLDAVVLCIVLAIVVVALTLSSAKDCSYESLSNDGYITSPGYPEQYPSNYCRVWVYNVRPGVVINVRFIDIDIPTDDPNVCSNDYLRIGPFNQKSYCGSMLNKHFEPYSSVVSQSYYWLKIIFRSKNVGIKGIGFKIYYQFKDTYAASTTSSSIFTTSIPSTVPTSETWTDTFSCNFVFTEQTGTITSNTTILDCLRRTNKVSWLIYYPGYNNDDVRYEIILKECDLPYQDKLIIYNGVTNTDNILRSYPKNQCPDYLMSLQNGVFIEYTSQNSGYYPLLRLTFSLSRSIQTSSTEPPVNPTLPTENQYMDQCSFILNDDTGEINSNYLTSIIQKTVFCTWLLRSSPSDGQKTTYELSVVRFNISPDSVFNVYDGSNMSAEVLGSYLSLAQFNTIRSSHNSMFIYYNPRSNFGNVGVTEVFNIKYYKVVTCAEGYSPCGYGEPGCYHRYNYCDDIWHCPLHGGDEKGCTTECPTDYSCGFRSSGCYSENERCNGKGICPNNMDEQNCNAEKCSLEKGLFLCQNGRCVYDTLRCDQMNNCLDNSDEENCYSSPSMRIIAAAVACTLTSALVLVIAMGCVCKLYHIRVRRLIGGPRHETPLSRQLSEMLRHRAPPPPYHEAMLTSRPYSEAYLELLNQTEDQSESTGLLNNGYQEDADAAPSRQQTESNSRQGSRSNRDNLQMLSENQHTSSRHRPEYSRLVEFDTLPLYSEGVENRNHRDNAAGGDPALNREPPPYSSADSSLLTGSSPEDNWQGGFDSMASTVRGIFNSSSGGDSLIQMEMISPNAALNPPADQASTFSSSLRNSNETRSNLSVESSGMEVVEEDDDKIQDDVDIIDEDSDSDCILAGNDADDDDDDNSTDSDVVCILDEV